MFRFKQTLLTLGIIIGLATILPLPIQAAQFYSGSTLNFSTSDKLQDAYVAGQTISINTPITNDLVVVGGTITIQQNIDNGLLAAGGTVTVNANVGQSARVAGGTVIINGQVNRDVVVAGGDVTITKTAKVLGDVVVYAGTITIDGPVDGKVTLNGGKATINSTVGRVTDSHIDSLTLGSQAIVNGDLQYQSPQEVQLDHGALIKGQTTYHRTTQSANQPVRGLATFGFFYNIMAGLIFSLVLLWLAHKVTNQAVLHLKQSPGLTFAWGLGATFLLAGSSSWRRRCHHFNASANPGLANISLPHHHVHGLTSQTSLVYAPRRLGVLRGWYYVLRRVIYKRAVKKGCSLDV
jgi:cytoskeletal protein CcmA (bactofilin family)